MSLILNFISILNDWRGAFTKAQPFQRAREHAIASLCCIGRRTITNFIILLCRDQQDHSADYKLYSQSKWQVSDLFNPILKTCLTFFSGDYIVVGADDTSIRKTGKKIPFASWRRDPMGPPFQTNLIWGLRFLQFSVLLPIYSAVNCVHSARSIPIRFISAPSVKKPGKKASKEEVAAYKLQARRFNLSTVFVENVKKLRTTLDLMGMAAKTLLVVADASFCNMTCLAECIKGVQLLVRTRKNARLHLQARRDKRRFYSKDSFTPEEFRKANQKNYKRGWFNYGGARHKVRYLELKNVYWKSKTKRRPLRLLVIAPLPYVRGGKRYYRDPGFLLCTDLKADIELLIQSYLDRWQIEVSFREEKTSLGVGQAQVWNESSVEKQPAFVVAAYAALLLAGVLTYQDQYHPELGEEPKWRSKPKRLTIRHLVGTLRQQVIENPEVINSAGLTLSEIVGILRKAA